MKSDLKGISFEKDSEGKNQYVRIEINRYAEELKPFFEKIGVSKLNDWDEGLTSQEFLEESKKLLRKKFDERNPIP